MPVVAVGFEVTGKRQWFRIDGTEGPTWTEPASGAAIAAVESYSGKVRSVEMVEGFGVRLMLIEPGRCMAGAWLVCSSRDEAAEIARELDPAGECDCQDCHKSRADAATLIDADAARAEGGYGAN